MKSFRIEPAQGGFGSTNAIPFSDQVMSRALVANTAESITVPTGARIAVFSANVDFFANSTTTATVPGDVTDGSASILNPVARSVEGVTTISVITAASGGGIVQAAFYA